MAGATIRLRCTDGDVVTYPLVAIRLEIDGLSLPVTAAVAERLPVSVLLGTDVPELQDLINQLPHPHTEELAMTQAQARVRVQNKKRQWLSKRRTSVRFVPAQLRSKARYLHWTMTSSEIPELDSPSHIGRNEMNAIVTNLSEQETVPAAC